MNRAMSLPQEKVKFGIQEENGTIDSDNRSNISQNSFRGRKYKHSKKISQGVIQQGVYNE